jgi:Prolipoprotein diacylglyceryl transferase
VVAVARVLTLPPHRVADPADGVFRRRGAIGIAMAVGTSLLLAAVAGRSLAVQAAVAATGVAVFLALALGAKAVLGRERIVCWHHQLAVLGAAAGVAALLGAPVLGHLDVTAVGLGAFLACARTGCLAVGCCHGRPTDRLGVVYGEAHVRAGLPAYLAGVPLVPCPAIEAAAAASAAAAGAALVAGGPAAGLAFAAYLGGYALVRLGLEEWRGDVDRPYWRGRSEAQWTAVAAIAVLSLAIAFGLLPAPRWVGAALPVLAGLVLAAAVRSAAARGGVLQQASVRDLVRSLRPARRGVVRTPDGLLISAGFADGHPHYALSREPDALDLADARALARVILWLAHPARDANVVRGPAAVWHVIVDR